jgi:hypothetical protein
MSWNLAGEFKGTNLCAWLGFRPCFGEQSLLFFLGHSLSILEGAEELFRGVAGGSIRFR